MIAVDTNILVYSVDAADAVRREKAARLLKDLEAQPTVILWQVLVEVGAVLSRKKAKSELKVPIGSLISAWLDLFEVQVPSKKVALDVWRLMDAYQLSYFDALIIGACIDAGATRLYSEDIQSGPQIEGVEIVNPFAA
jgi:predicted nucleic acid-binding protein